MKSKIQNLKSKIELSLSLFVFGVHADDAHDAAAMNDLALIADFFD
jgi:hypothetical protein